MKIANVFVEKFNAWIDSFISHTPNIALALLVFGLSFYISKKVKKITITMLAKRDLKLSARNMLGNIMSVLVIILCFFIALNILNLNNMLKAVLAGAGVAGLAIGLALQGTLSNTFSGITLSFIKDLRIGDQIETNGYRGFIEDINLRVVTIRQADNNLVNIPNKLILDNPFINYSATDTSVVMIECGVAYDSDLDEVKKVVTDTIRQQVRQVLQPEKILFWYTEFADSSINFKVGFITQAKSVGEMNAAKSDAIIAIKKQFDQRGINIPFPIRTIDLPAELSAGLLPKKN